MHNLVSGFGVRKLIIKDFVNTSAKISIKFMELGGTERGTHI